MVLHYNIRVTGRVQGVFFRVSTQQEARNLGLTGFVRNEPDGSVYLEVEGDREKIDRLLQWIKAGGPPRGKVNRVEITEGAGQGFADFLIR